MQYHPCPRSNLESGAAERRQSLARGVSPGDWSIKIRSSPGGATENNIVSVLETNAQAPVAPPGLRIFMRTCSRGLRPGLRYFAPPGLLHAAFERVLDSGPSTTCSRNIAKLVRKNRVLSTAISHQRLFWTAVISDGFSVAGRPTSSNIQHQISDFQYLTSNIQLPISEAIPTRHHAG